MKYLKIFGALIIIGVLAIIAYGNSMHAPLLYDDAVTVQKNVTLRDITNIVSIFKYSISRPLLNLSYAMTYYFWGTDPFGYHLFNLVTHIVNAFLIYLIVFFAIGEKTENKASRFYYALFPAIIFTVHPLFTSAVTYISARSSVLCTFFYLSTVLGFGVFLQKEVKSKRRIFFILAFCGFLLALATKEEAVTIPAVLLLYDWFRGERSIGLWKRFRSYHWPFWLVLVAGGAVRLYLFFRLEGARSPVDFSTGFLTQAKVSLKYLWLLIYPARLNFLPDYPPTGALSDAATLASLGIIAAILAVAWWFRKKVPVLAFLITSFFIVLSPYFVIPLVEAMSEHRAYLPGVGYCIGLGAGLAWLYGRGATADKIAVQALTIAGVILIMLIFVSITVHRNRVWGSEITLFEDTAEKSPHSWRPRYGLADAYLRAGDFDRAETNFRMALALNPRYPDGWVGLGVSHLKRGKLDEAEQALTTALRFDPDYVKTLNNLGIVAFYRGERGKAAGLFGQVLASDPINFTAHKYLGDIFYPDSPEKAFYYYHEALRVSPLFPEREQILGRLQEIEKR